MHARVHELIDGAIVDVGDAEKPMPKTSIVAVRSHQPPAPLSVAPGFLTEMVRRLWCAVHSRARQALCNPDYSNSAYSSGIKEGDRRGSNPRPPLEPQSADTCFRVLLYVAE